MIKGNKQEKTLHPYKIGVFSFLPVWFKIYFIKWWFVGMAFFFLGFGGTFFAPGSYERLFSIGAVIGLLNSYIVSRLIRDLSRLEDESNPYLSVRKKGPVATLFHIVLSVLIVILVSFSYEGINRLSIVAFSLDKDKVSLPAEPISFALLYLGYDFFWRKLTFRSKNKNNIKKSGLKSQ